MFSSTSCRPSITASRAMASSSPASAASGVALME